MPCEHTFFLLPFKMAAIPAISMYRLPTYYEEMVVPLPKCMYNFPSYFQTNSEKEVSRLVSIACYYKDYFLLHVHFPEPVLINTLLTRISYYPGCPIAGVFNEYSNSRK